MTRIDELQKKYPDVHKHIIAKWDIINRGVKDTPDLDKVGGWAQPYGSYQSYDHDITPKDMAEKTPWRVKPGFLLRPPNALYFNSGLGAKIMRSTRSPYTIRETSDGKFGLFEGEEKVDVDIYFAPPRQRTREQAVTSKGTPVSDLVGLNRRCFSIIPVRHCEYFTTGDECKFCNFNPSQEDARSIGFGRPVTVNLAETVEAYRILSSEVRLIEGGLESGGFLTSETEGSVNYRFVEKIASAASYKPNLVLTGEAMERKEYQRLKDAGLDSLRIQMEVWDERLFPEIVPGKAKHLSREGWIEAFHNAVDIFGVGNVSGKFVAGITLIPENGFKTWQEARDSHIEGNTWCIKNGLFAAFTPLRWAPGSPISRDPANWDKFPPTEYYLDLALAHHEACMEYGMYEQLNKFLYCGLDCVAYTYSGELGMLELAGDVGTWMSAVVPHEANWVAQFVASTKSPAKTH